MPDFPAGSFISTDNFSINDYAAAHSGPKRNHYNIRISFAAALPHFAKRSHICVIADFYGKARPFFHILCNINHIPAQVDAF